MESTFSHHDGHSSVSGLNAQIYTPYTRINREMRDTKRLAFFMNDSTYVNASDPNSMRD